MSWNYINLMIVLGYDASIHSSNIRLSEQEMQALWLPLTTELRILNRRMKNVLGTVEERDFAIWEAVQNFITISVDLLKKDYRKRLAEKTLVVRLFIQGESQARMEAYQRHLERLNRENDQPPSYGEVIGT